MNGFFLIAHTASAVDPSIVVHVLDRSFGLQDPQWALAARESRQHVSTTLDWYGCATFRLSTAGLAIFLDAYIDRAPNAAGAGRSAGDVTECDWILIGHSHFDHLFGAEKIMANTSATLIGSYETVRVMEGAGVAANRMLCVAGGETIDLGHDVRVTAYPSTHSCVWSQQGMRKADEVCIGDLGVTLQEQRVRMAELATHLTTELDPVAAEHLLGTMSGHSPRGDGGALLYHLETPDGTLLFQDTSGHWTGVVDQLRPDVAIVAAAGRANVNGEPIQGTLAEFVADHVARLQPRQVVLSHHDNWLPGFSVATDIAPIRAAIGRRAPDATLLEPGYVDGSTIF
jgi:L-ascorbate metabolism protein UlaG (beta-lactamase superfamily)